MSLTCALFEDEDEREIYIVTATAALLLIDPLKPVLLTTCISRQSVVFLWPVPLPKEAGGGGAMRGWGDSARQAAHDGKQF